MVGTTKNSRKGQGPRKVPYVVSAMRGLNSRCARSRAAGGRSARGVQSSRPTSCWSAANISRRMRPGPCLLGNQAPGRLVVSIGSKGFRRLHQHLHCYLRPGVHYHRFEFGDDFDEMEFHSLCKLCWPRDTVEAQQKDDLWVDVGEPDSCSAPCTSSSSDSSSSSSPMPCSSPPSRELARLALTRLT